MKTHPALNTTEYYKTGEPTAPSVSFVLNQCPCVTWILDVRSETYTFISDNTLEYFGHANCNYVTGGRCFQDQITHPDDRQNTRQLWAQIWLTLSNIPTASRAGYKFSYDYRIIRPDGKIIRILEQNSVLQQDKSGNITHLLGICSDITNYKKNGPQCGQLSSEIDEQHHFFTAEKITEHKPSSILSKRELEIVKLIAEGQSSKIIADKLFISFHTVNTHRQKMIEKTNTRNTGGLVQFAICNGLI